MNKPAFALPLSMISMVMVMALGLYVWKELALMHDLLTVQDRYRMITEQLEKAFDELVEQISYQFSYYVQQVKSSKKIIMHTDLIEQSLEPYTQAQQALLLKVQHKKTGHSIVGVVGQIKQNSVEREQHVFVDFVTFGIGH